MFGLIQQLSCLSFSRWWQRRIKMILCILCTLGLRNCWVCTQRTTGATSACPIYSPTETTVECWDSPGRVKLVSLTHCDTHWYYIVFYGDVSEHWDLYLAASAKYMTKPSSAYKDWQCESSSKVKLKHPVTLAMPYSLRWLIMQQFKVKILLTDRKTCKIMLSI